MVSLLPDLPSVRWEAKASSRRGSAQRTPPHARGGVLVDGSTNFRRVNVGMGRPGFSLTPAGDRGPFLFPAGSRRGKAGASSSEHGRNPPRKRTIEGAPADGFP